MFRMGGSVIHGEYGLGTFKGVFGTRVKIAVVEFTRGSRCFVLPAAGLTALSERSDCFGRSRDHEREETAR